MALLESVEDLTLDQLNDITQAWVEEDYHRHHHKEIGTTPLRRFLDSPSVGRPSPNTRHLRQAFRQQVTRRQRQSDGTLTLAGKRFEVPSVYRSLRTITLHYARWDLSTVDMVDPHTQKILSPLYPLDKSANANGWRRPLSRELPAVPPTSPNPAEKNVWPPLLQKILADYAASGRPPAYLPQQKTTESSIRQRETETDE